MEPVERVSGTALPLGYSDVDTDQIVPSDALKRIERTGFGQFLFSSWREDEDFIMHRKEHEDAVILIAGENFGSGSSREHAVWAIKDYGFDAVIAPSFADIFRNNCMKNGVLPVTLRDEEVAELVRRAREVEGYRLTVDLERCEVRDEQGFKAAFEIDEFRRQCLLEGLDDVGLTLRHESLIRQFEERRPDWMGVTTTAGA